MQDTRHKMLYIYVHIYIYMIYIYIHDIACLHKVDTHILRIRGSIFILHIFFSIFQSAIKLAGKNNVKKLQTLLVTSIVEEKPKVDTGQNNRHNEHHIKNNFKHNHYTHNSILTPSTLNQVIE